MCFNVELGPIMTWFVSQMANPVHISIILLYWGYLEREIDILCLNFIFEMINVKSIKFCVSISHKSPILCCWNKKTIQTYMNIAKLKKCSILFFILEPYFSLV